MSRVPLNVPASIRSVMDSCTSVVIGEPELDLANLCWGSSTGRSRATIFERALANLVPPQELRPGEIAQALLHEVFPPTAKLVRGAALNSEAALPWMGLHDRRRRLQPCAVGCGAATPSDDARQQDDHISLQPRNGIRGGTHHRGNPPAAP